MRSAFPDFGHTCIRWAWAALGLLLACVVGVAAENRVLDLDGKGSFVELPSDIFNELDEATIEGWIKFKEFRTESRFFDFGTMGPGMYLTEANETTTLRFLISEGNDSPEHKVEVENALRLDQWCHIAAVTGREGMKLYLNGVLLGTNAYTGSFRAVRNGEHNYLGRNNWKAYFRAEDFRGQMDEIRVWRKARTQQQIQDHLFQRLAGNENDLAGLWNFDDGAARDSTANLHHGKLMGSARCVVESLSSSQELLRPMLLHGTVSDENRTPLRGAAIVVEQGDSRIAEVSTDSNGQFRTAVYPAGEAFDVSATSGLKGGWQLNLRLLPGEWRRMDFVLSDASILAGSVESLDARKRQGCIVVQALRVNSGVNHGLGSENSGSVADTKWTDDANGRFAFINLKPGQYRLRCQGKGEFIYFNQGAPVEVGAGIAPPEIRFRFPPVKKGVWRSHTLLDGLPVDDVRDLVFDREGVMWLATWGGVVRFDGASWSRFTKDDGLSDNRVNAVARDANGGLWFATEKGLNYLANRQWRRFFKADGLADDRVRALAPGLDGSIWLATAGGVSRFDGQHWETIDENQGLPDNEVTSLCRDTAGVWWFGTKSGVCHYDGKTVGGFSADDGHAGAAVHAIHCDGDGVIWIGSARGLSRHDGRTRTHFSAKDGLRPGFVRSIRGDANGGLWIAVSSRAGANDGGVSRWDGRTFLCFGKADGLAGHGVRSICQSPDGAMWFAAEAGVSRFDPASIVNFTTADGLPNDEVSRLSAFLDGIIWFWRVTAGVDDYHWADTDPGDGLSRYDGASFTTFTTAHGMTGNRVSALFRDSVGNYWVTGQGGVSCYKGRGFSRFADGDEWGNDGGICIAGDTDGTLWFGRHNGISRYDGRGVVSFSSKNVLANQHVSAIHRDANGALWLATLHRGLWRYDGERFLNFTTNHGLPSKRIHSIQPAPDGGLWFRTDHGVARYDGKKFTAFTSANGLAEDKVNVVHIDPDGTVWIGTASSGITRFRDGAFATFSAARDRVAHDKINTIYRDTGGVLWFGTDGGVSQYNGISWSSMDERDGLAGNRVNAIAQTTDGVFWIATDKGLTRYERNGTRPNPPTVTLETGEVPRQSSLPTVTLGRRVTVDFHAVDFNNRPQNQKFRWQIRSDAAASPGQAGEEWIPPAAETRLEWSTNKPGRYTIAVQYVDRDLRISEPTLVALDVVAPWYLNAWIAVPSAAGLLALLSSSLFWGSRYYSKRQESQRLREAMFQQERRAREALEANNSQLLAATEAAQAAMKAAEQANKAKSLFLANMSHEIRTPMNAILGYAQILQLDPALSRKQRHALEIIRKSGDHLLALIDDILDLSKIEAGKLQLNISSFSLSGLLKDLAAIFELRCQQKSLTWHLELEASSDESFWNREGAWVRGDPAKLGQVLMNLLANAVKFTDRGRVAFTATAKGGGEYRFEVSDTGRGIPFEKRNEIFRPFGQADSTVAAEGAGLGLAIAKQTLELMGSALQFESARGQGSRFFFSIQLPGSRPETPAVSNKPRERTPRLAPEFEVDALVVDDRPEIREVLCEMLGQLGCLATSVRDGFEALEAIRTHPPDVVFMDIRLPGMDGLETTRKIIQEFGRGTCKVVSVSASAMAHERKAYLEAGFDDFLAKPVRVYDLCQTLTRLLNVEFEDAISTQALASGDGRHGLSNGPIPEDLMAKLRQAAEEANVTKLRTHLDDLERMDGKSRKIAEDLRESLEKYDLKGVLNRISELHEHFDSST